MAVFLSLLCSFAGSLSCEGEKRSEFKARANSAPSVTSVTISPEKPNRETDLSFFVQSQDPDRDPVTYEYQWMKNDLDLAGEKKEILTCVNFKKGDVIRVKVTPSDGKVEGTPFLSPPVKILNSPPVVQEIRIDPQTAYASDPLKVHVKGFDADGDFIYYAYQWEKNGVVLTDDTGEVLDRERFKKGDSISVTVFPDDREAKGAPKKSEPVVIGNSPPIITSAPSTAVEGMTYQYQVKAHDPDRDPMQFVVKAGPKGMTIDKETGLIRWEIRKEDRGAHSIEVEASDNSGGRSIQRYTLTVEYR